MVVERFEQTGDSRLVANYIYYAIMGMTERCECMVAGR